MTGGRLLAALALGGLLLAVALYALGVVWGADDPGGGDTDGWR